MAKDEERYGSAKIEIDEVLGALKKRKKEEKSYFDLLDEKSTKLTPHKKSEESELIKKIEKLLKILEESQEEDPIYELTSEISRKLDIVINKLDGITSRLDSFIRGENPQTAELEGDLKKVALEIEILSPGEKISLETLAERAGLDEKRVLEILKELTSRGFNIDIVEEEKKRSIFSKKKTSIIKR